MMSMSIPVETGTNLLRMIAMPEMPPGASLFGSRNREIPAAREKHPKVMTT